MNYRQLGNGGAFDYLSVNSSFVIEKNDQYLLFDCGYSVFAELRRLNDDINENFNLPNLSAIYISHMDDDHIGSLKALLYYQFFTYGITTKVFTPESILSDITSFLGKSFNSVYDDNQFIPTTISTWEAIPDEHPRMWNDISLDTTPTSHHVDCRGLIFSEREGNHNISLYISGDTKALVDIRNIIQNIDDMSVRYKVFHDFSNWDCEPKQVHACQTDVDNLYTEVTKSRIEWYHNNAPFNNKWRQL